MRTRKSTAIHKTWNIQSQVPPSLNVSGIDDNQIYRFAHLSDLSTVFSTSTSTITGTGLNFQISNIPNSSSYLSLFDQYRITKIEVWIQAQNTNNGGHTGMLYSAVDYDASATGLTPTQLSQYANVTIAPLGSIGHFHSFVPHVAVAAYSGTFTSYANETAPWIDSNSPNVQHYGVVLSAPATTDVIAVDARVRYFVEFRNTI